MSAASYGLMDRETANLIGVYPSLAAALRDALEAIHRYGRDSRAVQSLALAREDVEPDQGFVAAGDDLALIALRLEAKRIP
jgi:hypothetical protein